MTFRFPKDALPPKRTPAEEVEFHLRAQEQYARLRASYVEKRRKEDEAYRRFRSYGSNNEIETPPDERGRAPEPAGE